MTPDRLNSLLFKIFSIMLVTIFVACGGSGSGSEVIDPDPVVNDPEYRIDIQVTASLLDGSDGIANAGDEVDYTIRIENTGTAALTDITVSNTEFMVNGGPLASLAAGATDNSTFTSSYFLQQTDVDEGLFQTVFEIEAKDANADLVTDTATSSISFSTFSSIGLGKEAMFQDMNNNGFADLGDRITYTFTAMNQGNVTLDSISLNDDRLGIVSQAMSPNSIEPGETAAWQAVYSITESDLSAGFVENTAIVEALDPSSTAVNDLSDDPANTTNVDSDADGDPDDPTVTLLTGDPSQNERYNSFVFDSAISEQDVLYGKAITQGGIEQNLLMDIYTGQGDTLGNRPVIVLAHGGSFVAGDKMDMHELAEFYARSGYVAVSIQYRLLDVVPGDGVLRNAVIDAMHDMKAAVRYLKQNAVDLGLNADNVFVGGYSAGAITALHLAYLDSESEVELIGGNQLLQYLINSGGMEGNSGNPGISSAVTGVVNIAGALGGENLLSAGDPVIYSVHGTDDSVVPYGVGFFQSSGIELYGSLVIHQNADLVGISNQLRSLQGGGHTAPLACTDCLDEMRAFLFDFL